MRISDWSSDVCSSDLLNPAQDLARGGVDVVEAVAGGRLDGAAADMETGGGKPGHGVTDGCSFRMGPRHTGALLGGSGSRPRIMSAAFSPIMIVGAFRFPETIVGMIEESTIRRPSTPWTRASPSTTALASLPILQAPAG